MPGTLTRAGKASHLIRLLTFQPMTVRHIVWDWNGTLLDDLGVVIEALNVGVMSLGQPPIDERGYRDHFTRPVRSFYDSIFGRAVSDMEWSHLNKMFHVEYFSRVGHAGLTHDALEAMGMIDEIPWTQSLLSMTPHDKLLEIVGSHGILERFTLVDGLHIETGGLKAAHLVEHLTALGISGEDLIVIGDTPDDASAARHVGASVVLYDGGSHHLPHLEELGEPVAHSLVSAVEIAMGLE